MAKRKRRVEEEERELTRKEIRLRTRDRKRNQRLYTGTGIAIGLALLLVVIGAVWQFAVRPGTAIASVGEDQIVTRDFWKRIRFERWQLQNQLFQMQQLEQQFGQGIFGNQISQIQNTLANPGALATQVLDRMIDETVAEQQAVARNITVSEQEIEDALREEIANSRGAITEPQATSTAEAGAEATATASGWTPTPMPTLDLSSTVTATATALPTSEPLPTSPLISDTGYTEGLNLWTENLETATGLSLADYRDLIRLRLLTDKLQEQIGEEQVKATEEQVHARHILLNIREPAPTPTATVTSTVTAPLTASLPLTDLAGLAAPTTVTSPVDVTTTEEMTASTGVTATSSVSEPSPVTSSTALTDASVVTPTVALTDTVELTGAGAISNTPDVTTTLATDPNAPRSDAETLALAQELRSRILNGEDFASLAMTYSDDASNAGSGGDLEWFGRGRMAAPFEEAAFSLPLNQVSEPVKTEFGYHLIEVLEKDENRPKDEAQFGQERQEAYQNWLQEQKSATVIERPEDLVAYLPPD
jgi:parvulin-like peptidyl-prolyl isomerase